MNKNKPAFLSHTLISMLVCCSMVGITPKALAITQDEAATDNSKDRIADESINVRARQDAQ